MKVLRSMLWIGLVGTLVASCGGSGGGTPIGPPAGNDEIEPNDFTPQVAGVLTDALPDIALALATSSASDVDLFRVTTARAGALAVELEWTTSADLELSISNASGIFVRHVDGSGHPESCTLTGLAPGDYTVRVGSHTNTSTSYTLRLGLR